MARNGTLEAAIMTMFVDTRQKIAFVYKRIVEIVLIFALDNRFSLNPLQYPDPFPPGKKYAVF
jgi:hypothetical protein